MIVELTVTSNASTQRVNLPVSETATDSDINETEYLFLSLVVGGDTTHSILGGIGPYFQNHHPPEALQFLRNVNLSPTLEIKPGQTTSIGFRFTKYPRELDPHEHAFRLATFLS
jgi:hypothetical protein